MKRFVTLLHSLLFPPKCPGCHRRLAELAAPSALCPECAEVMERAMRAQCPQCFAAYRACRCQSKPMERAGVRELVKLAPYNREELAVPSHVILYLKTHASKRVFDVLAELLVEGVLAALVRAEITPQQTVLTHLPRLRRTYRREGVDQAKELALALSRKTGIPYAPHLRRVRDTKEQKTLSATARRQNLKGAFVAQGELAGKCVLLVDDVVTSGAGMSVGCEVLRHAGAAHVIGVCIAVTERKLEKKG